MNDYYNTIDEKLNSHRSHGLYRELKYLETSQSTKVHIDGKEMLMFSSNNYLGLCDDARLKEAAINAVNTYGVGSGGSRLTTGSFILHKELEEKIANFKKTEASLVFNTGYMANLGTITAIVNKEWVVYCDRLNHASIIDAIRLSGAKLVVYKHCDMDDLLKKVKRFNGNKGIIITDGVFSMDGDISPLDKIVEIAKQYDLITMVDDAHATGVIGPVGAGSVDFYGLTGHVDIQMGTLSKALASEGGYVAGKQVMIDYLKNFARSFIYSTAISPQTIAVSLKSLDIIINEPQIRQNLAYNVNYIRDSLLSLGFNIASCNSNIPIIPIMIGDAKTAVSFSNKLYEEGVFIPAIRPPTVKDGTSRLRLTVIATHTKEDLDACIDKMACIAKQLGII